MDGDHFAKPIEEKVRATSIYSLITVAARLLVLFPILWWYEAEEGGAFFFYRSAFYLVAIFLLSPLLQALLRYVPLWHRRREGKALSTQLTLLSLALLLFIAFLLSAIYRSWEAFLTALGAGIYYIYYTYATAWNKIYVKAYLLPLPWVLFLLALLALHALGWESLESLTYAYVGSNAILLPFLARDVRRKLSLAPADLKEALLYGFSAAMTNQRNYAFNALDSFLVGSLIGMEAVMAYTAAIEPYRRTFNGIVKPLSATLTAHLPLLGGEKRRGLVKAYLKKGLLLLLLPIFFYPLLPHLSALLFPSYAQHWPLSFLYLLALYPIYATYIMESYFKAEGAKKVLFTVSTAGAFLNALLSYATALLVGLAGPVISTTLSWWGMALSYFRAFWRPPPG